VFSAGEAYDRFMGRWSQRLATAFVEFAGVEAGDRVLDVGLGTGSLTNAVLERSSTTRVVGIDPSAEYVNFVRARLGAPDAGRATLEEGDAQRLRFADGSFDKALSLLVLNFIPDRDAALREMIRVTSPGGAVASAVWDYGGGMEMLRTFWDEAVSLNPAAEPKDERHMPLCRAGELAALWRAHGLVDVEEQPLVIVTEFSSFDDFWQPFFGGQGPAGAYAVGLPENQRRGLEQRLRGRVVRGRQDGAVQLSARAWAVRGERR
jgi:SAM-dependent methyltransferase